MKVGKNFIEPFLKVLIYLILGIIWIFFTDYLVLNISKSISVLYFFQLIKGILYVILTGIGLYFVIYFYNKDLIKTTLLLQKKTRLFNMLSQCNQILVRQTKESEFLSEICRLIVEIGGYKMVWIGMKQNDEEKSVKPVACFGFENGYLENIKISWGDNEYGKGPTGTAIRTGQTVVFSNLEKSSDYKMWFNTAKKRGYKSSCAIPIVVENEIFGVLNIYSSTEDYFDEEELKLIEEMAKDIGYGIGERRKYAENLELLEKIKEDNIKLKEIDKLKNNFLAIISHELRTPITPIRGFIDVLLKTSDNLSEKQKEFLEIVKSNTVRLQKIIEDLIDCSRIERGTIEINKENINICELINEVIKDMKYLIEQNNIKIKFERKNVEVLVDKYRISQVLINLLNNAIKFSDKGGIIEIGCEVIEGKEIVLPEYLNFEIDKGKKYILIYVKDFGRGIKKDVLAKIFDAFYQIDEPLIRKTGGLGIGLTIAKKIVHLHGGEIWAESEGLGLGAKFNFILPIL